MASIREIRNRIKSVKSTQQITKAMKMVSVSKLRKNQSANDKMTDFEKSVSDVMMALLNSGSELDSIYNSPHKKNEKAVYVLFTGNRGLCGTYNNALISFSLSEMKSDTREKEVVLCGSVGADTLRSAGLKVIKEFSSFSDTPKSEEAGELTSLLKEIFVSEEADEVILMYQAYASALTQKPTRMTLLPLSGRASSDDDYETVESSTPYEFAPDKASVIEAVTELYLHTTVFKVMTEARCAEHAARMMAMTSASENTEELIDELSLNLNRVRQAAITTEISEIVGGAAALEKAND